MLLLIMFAFLAGVVTVLSPCILPLLPIILSSSDSKQRQKPVGVVIGFVSSFTFFTLFLSTIVRFSGIPADSLRIFSVAVLALFGASLLISQIQAQIEIFFSKFANLMPSSQNKTGLWGGVVIGVSLGLLWTPCVGPILASVISLAITGTVTAQAFFITLAYATGTAIPMFLIILAGSTALQKVPWLLKNTANIQESFGVLMILTAIGIVFNVDRHFQTWVLETFPNYGLGLTRFEETEKINTQLQKINKETTDDSVSKKSLLRLSGSKKVSAPELIQGGEWFNSSPLQLSELRGKVVLVDFWTYSCINCQRTLPYLKTWWEKYKDKGLVIIGVHSPEFEFEKDSKNVQRAIEDFELSYPIVQDNDFATWRAYNNRYWPAKYLIDADGSIQYTHFGEGDYDKTEEMIQKLLEEAGKDVSTEDIKNPNYQTFGRTPELYLGHSRIEYLASPEKIEEDQTMTFSAPESLSANEFAFAGDWAVMSEYAVPSKGAHLYLNFEAKETFLVARPRSGTGGKMKVTLDGEVQATGVDNNTGTVTVDSDRLYKLIKLSSAGRHILEIEFLDNNVEVYAFTFG